MLFKIAPLLYNDYKAFSSARPETRKKKREKRPRFAIYACTAAERSEAAMRTAGIIAEYNPFHNGHAWQIAELKKRGFEAVVCVCSPGVVQRGTAALFPARVRTRAALAARGGPGAQPAGTLRYAVRRGLCSGGCGAAECAGLCGCSVFRHRDTAAGGYRPNRSAAGKPGLSSSAARAAGRGPAAPRRPRGGGGSAVSGSRRGAARAQ